MSKADEYAEFVVKNIHQRLAAAMGKVSYIQKDELKSGMKYRVVTHDKVTALVRPALLDAGVVYYPHEIKHEQVGNRTEVSMVVRFANIDDPKDFIDVPSLGYGIDSQDKGPGKAISYCVKYALLKALGLETGDDPDMDQTTEHKMLAPDGTEVLTLDDALKTCADAIQTIINGIDEGDLSVASEAWHELTGGEKMGLWVAPTKGGPFTTKQREIIKSAEFRQAHYGQDAAA